MRVLTINEPLRLTRIELCDLGTRMTAELPTFPDGFAKARQCAHDPAQYSLGPGVAGFLAATLRCDGPACVACGASTRQRLKQRKRTGLGVERSRWSRRLRACQAHLCVTHPIRASPSGTPCRRKRQVSRHPRSGSASVRQRRERFRVPRCDRPRFRRRSGRS